MTKKTKAARAAKPAEQDAAAAPKAVKLKLPDLGPKDEPMKTMSGEHVDGALTPPLPKHVVFARDMRGDELYSNVFPQSIGEPYKMTRFAGISSNGKVKIDFYAGHLREWLVVEVPPSHLFTTDPRYVERMTKPVAEQRAKRTGNAARLKEHQFKKTKADPVATPANGKKAFKGKLGDDNVLFDVGDGSEVGRCRVGEDLAACAKKAKRELVGQGEASPYAMFVFTKKWQESRTKFRQVAGAAK